MRLAESLRHLERAYHRERVRHDRQVAARPRDTRLADRCEEVGVERHLALLLVDRQVLDHEHGVVVADGGLQQTLGVSRRGRGHDLQAGRAGEPAVERLRVLGGELIARPVRRADHQRTAHLAAEHRAYLGGVVDHLVHRNQQEVDRHDLHDRALAEHRRAHAGAHEPLLGDRRVADAIRAEGLQQSGGDLVGAVEQPNLLAHHEHAVVAGELLGQREPQRLAVGHDLRGGALGDGAHAPSPASKVSFSSPNGLPGRMRSNCAALPAACIPKARLFDGGLRAGERVLHRGLDLSLGGVVDRVQLVLGRARVDQLRSHSPDRVERLARGDLVGVAVGEPGIGDGVAAIAVGHRLEDRGPPLLAGLAQQAVGRLDNGVEVVAVDPLPVHPVGLGASPELGLGRRPAHRGAHAVFVVDHEEDDRQLPQRRQVERLVPGAHVHGAVAELAEHGLRAPLAHERQRQPGRHGQLAGDDAPPPVEAALDVEQVHRPAATVRAAVGAPEQLGHGRLRGDAARQREAVAAVAGHEQVLRLERLHRPDGGRLLAGREMAVAADPGRLVLPLGLGLEHAAEHHQLVQLAPQRGRYSLRRGLYDRHG